MAKQIVVGYGNNREIGSSTNELLWRLPADMQHFKQETVGGTIIMGGNTWRSIGRALPDRESIVITRGDIEVPGVIVARSLDEALGKASCELVSVIGGGEIYSLAMQHPDINQINATHVHADFPDATVFFPEIGPEWTMTEHEEHRADEKNPYDYDFLKLIRD